jgi:hypothetical protein
MRRLYNFFFALSLRPIISNLPNADRATKQRLSANAMRASQGDIARRIRFCYVIVRRLTRHNWRLVALEITGEMDPTPESTNHVGRWEVDSTRDTKMAIDFGFDAIPLIARRPPQTTTSGKSKRYATCAYGCGGSEYHRAPR